MTSKYRPLRRLASAGLALGLISGLVTVSAHAQEGVLVLPLDTAERGEPGSTVDLGTTPTPAELVGRDCTVEAQSQNNGSVHPDSDLLVSSDGSVVRLTDVEAEPGKITTADARLTLGETVSISVVMGPDGIFSGGASARVVVDCAEPEPPPTTTPTTTSVAVSPAPPPSTTAQVQGIIQVQPAPPAQATPSQPTFTG